MQFVFDDHEERIWPVEINIFPMFFIFCLFAHLLCASNIHPDDQTLLFNLMDNVQGFPIDWVKDSIESFCSWKGIHCTTDKARNQSRLQSLSLPESNLVGSLPPSGWLGAKFLNAVNFSTNYLYGPLPNELLSINGGHVELDNNELSGRLPDLLPNIGSNLFALDLRSNRFQGCIPNSWQSLQSLCTAVPPHCRLDLSNNYFNCNTTNCMQFLPIRVIEADSNQTFCPLPFSICQSGQFCWNIPPTIVLLITLMCGGFIVGILSMFVAAKLLGIGLPYEKDASLFSSSPVNSVQ